MSQAAFAKALAEFQSALPAVGKDHTAQAGQYSYSYADLTTIALAALPKLAEHGLSFIAKPTMSEYGFVLAYSLLHSEGHREDGFYPLPDPAKSNAQQIGSAITYARRYSLCAATGIAPGDDDDGAAAAEARSAPARSRSTYTEAPTKPADPLTAAKWRVKNASDALGWDSNQLEDEYAMKSDGQYLLAAAADELNAFAKDLEDRKKRVTA